MLSAPFWPALINHEQLVAGRRSPLSSFAPGPAYRSAALRGLAAHASAGGDLVKAFAAALGAAVLITDNAETGHLSHGEPGGEVRRQRPENASRCRRSYDFCSSGDLVAGSALAATSGAVRSDLALLGEPAKSRLRRFQMRQRSRRAMSPPASVRMLANKPTLLA